MARQPASQSGRMGRGHRLRPAGEKGASWGNYAVVVRRAGRRRGVGNPCAPVFTHCSRAVLEALVSKVEGGGWIWREERQGRVAADAPSAPAPSERSAGESSWVGTVRWGRLVFLVKWRPVPGRLSCKSHRFVCFAQVSEKTYVFGSENHSWGLELSRETSCSSGWGRIPKC